MVLRTVSGQEELAGLAVAVHDAQGVVTGNALKVSRRRSARPSS